MFLSGTKDDSIRELIRIKTNLNTASVNCHETDCCSASLIPLCHLIHKAKFMQINKVDNIFFQ